MKTIRTVATTIIASLAFSHSALGIDSFDELDREHMEGQREMDYAFDGCSVQDLITEKAKVEKLKSMMHERQNTIASLNKQIETLNANKQACNTSSLEQQISSLKIQNQNLNSEVEQLSSKLRQGSSDDSSQVTKLRSELRSIQSQLSEEQLKNRQLLNQISQLKAGTNASSVSSRNEQTNVVVTNVNAKKLSIKNVYATSRWNGNHQAQLMVDGNPGTMWHSKQRQVAGQSVKLDLGAAKTLSRIHILIPQNRFGQPPQFINAHFPDGSSQRVELEDKWGWHRLPISPVMTDSVDIELGELYSKQFKNSAVSIAEVELYGSDEEPVAQNTASSNIGEKLAVKNVYASSVDKNSRSVHAVFDGYNETSWRTKKGKTDRQYIGLSLKGEKTVTGIRLLADQDGLSQLPKSMRITLPNGSSQPVTLDKTQSWQTVAINPPIQTSGLTLHFGEIQNSNAKPSAIGFSEIEILGR